MQPYLPSSAGTDARLHELQGVNMLTLTLFVLSLPNERDRDRRHSLNRTNMCIATVNPCMLCCWNARFALLT